MAQQARNMSAGSELLQCKCVCVCLYVCLLSVGLIGGASARNILSVCKRGQVNGYRWKKRAKEQSRTSGGLSVIWMNVRERERVEMVLLCLCTARALAQTCLALF